MSYQLIRKSLGKEKVIAQGDYKKVRKEKERLLKSQRKGISDLRGKKIKVEYIIKEQDCSN